MPWGVSLSWVRGLADELDRLDAEIGVAARGGRNACCVVAREMARQCAATAARVVRGDDEADPADDVVLRIRARPGQQTVDRKQHFLPDHRVQRALELRVVEVRGRS